MAFRSTYGPYDSGESRRSPRDSNTFNGSRRGAPERASTDSRSNSGTFPARNDSYRDSGSRDNRDFLPRDPPRAPKALIGVEPPSGPRAINFDNTFRGRGRGRGGFYNRDDSRDRSLPNERDYRDRREDRPAPAFRDDRNRDRDWDDRDRRNREIFRGRRRSPPPLGRARSPGMRDTRDIIRDGPGVLEIDRARRNSRDGPLSAGSSSSDPPILGNTSFRGGFGRGRGRGRGEWEPRGRGRGGYHDEREHRRSRSPEGTRWAYDDREKDLNRNRNIDLIRDRDDRSAEERHMRELEAKRYKADRSGDLWVGKGVPSRSNTEAPTSAISPRHETSSWPGDTPVREDLILRRPSTIGNGSVDGRRNSVKSDYIPARLEASRDRWGSSQNASPPPQAPQVPAFGSVLNRPQLANHGPPILAAKAPPTGPKAERTGATPEPKSPAPPKPAVLSTTPTIPNAPTGPRAQREPVAGRPLNRPGSRQDRPSSLQWIAPGLVNSTPRGNVDASAPQPATQSPTGPSAVDERKLAAAKREAAIAARIPKSAGLLSFDVPEGPFRRPLQRNEGLIDEASESDSEEEIDDSYFASEITKVQDRLHQVHARESLREAAKELHALREIWWDFYGPADRINHLPGVDTTLPKPEPEPEIETQPEPEQEAQKEFEQVVENGVSHMEIDDKESEDKECEDKESEDKTMVDADEPYDEETETDEETTQKPARLLDKSDINSIKPRINTPPISSLPFGPIVSWQHDEQFMNSLELPPDFHHGLTILIAEKHQRRASELRDLQETYRGLYAEFNKWTISDDPDAIQERQKVEDAKSTVAPTALVPQAADARSEGRRAGSRFGTEHDLERVLEQSKREEKERQEQAERDEKAKRATEKEAEIPDMLGQDEKHFTRFADTSHRIPPERVIANFKCFEEEDNFTDEEHQLFEKAYMENPKVFGRIAESIPGKTFADCIQHYYLCKHKQELKKKLKANGPKGRGKRKKVKSTALTADLKPRDEVEDGPENGETTGGRTRPRRLAAPTFGSAVPPESEDKTPAPTPGRKAGWKAENPDGPPPVKKPRGRAAAKLKEQAAKAKASQLLAAAPAPPKPMDENVPVQPMTMSEWQPPAGAARTLGDPSRYPQFTGSPQMQATFAPPYAPPEMQATQVPVTSAAAPQTFVSQERIVPSTATASPVPGESTIPSQDRRSAQQTSSYWSVPEQQDFPALLAHFGTDWHGIAKWMTSKTHIMVKNYYQRKVDGGEKPDWKETVDRAEELKARGLPTAPLPAPSIAVNKQRYNPPTGQRTLASASDTFDDSPSSSIQPVLMPQPPSSQPILSSRFPALAQAGPVPQGASPVILPTGLRSKTPQSSTPIPVVQPSGANIKTARPPPRGYFGQEHERSSSYHGASPRTPQPLVPSPGSTGPLSSRSRKDAQQLSQQASKERDEAIKMQERQQRMLQDINRQEALRQDQQQQIQQQQMQQPMQAQMPRQVHAQIMKQEMERPNINQFELYSTQSPQPPVLAMSRTESLPATPTGETRRMVQPSQFNPRTQVVRNLTATAEVIGSPGVKVHSASPSPAMSRMPLSAPPASHEFQPPIPQHPIQMQRAPPPQPQQPVQPVQPPPQQVQHLHHAHQHPMPQQHQMRHSTPQQNIPAASPPPPRPAEQPVKKTSNLFSLLNAEPSEPPKASPVLKQRAPEIPPSRIQPSPSPAQQHQMYAPPGQQPTPVPPPPIRQDPMDMRGSSGYRAPPMTTAPSSTPSQAQIRIIESPYGQPSHAAFAQPQPPPPSPYATHQGTPVSYGGFRAPPPMVNQPPQHQPQQYRTHEAIRQDRIREDQIRQQEQIRQEQLRHESHRPEPMRQDSLRHDSMRHDSLRPESVRPESIRPEQQIRHEPPPPPSRYDPAPRHDLPPSRHEPFRYEPRAPIPPQDLRQDLRQDIRPDIRQDPPRHQQHPSYAGTPFEIRQYQGPPGQGAQSAPGPPPPPPSQQQQEQRLQQERLQLERERVERMDTSSQQQQQRMMQDMRVQEDRHLSHVQAQQAAQREDIRRMQMAEHAQAQAQAQAQRIEQEQQMTRAAAHAQVQAQQAAQAQQAQLMGRRGMHDERGFGMDVDRRFGDRRLEDDQRRIEEMRREEEAARMESRGGPPAGPYGMRGPGPGGPGPDRRYDERR